MNRFEKLDALLEHFLSMPGGPSGCALAVSLKGETIFEGYRGIADLASNTPVDQDTLFRLFSSGKVVTAVAFMLLLERGLVQLDDPLALYLPEYANTSVRVLAGNNVELQCPSRPITLKHLLTMTSGIVYDGDATSVHAKTKEVFAPVEANQGISTREFARRLAEVPLAFEPGSHWNYGFNLDVAGAVIEQVSGKKLSEYMRDEIFAPLGMEDTCFFCGAESRQRMATLYRYDRQAKKLVENSSFEHRYEPGYVFESGGGGLVSSLRDMNRFGTMLALGGTVGDVRILGRKTIDLMRQDHLRGQAREDFVATHSHFWEFMAGYSYGLGVKTLVNVADANCSGTPGEFSWAGAAGTLQLVDVAEGLSICYMHQLLPDNMEGYCHPRLRNVVYGLL